MKKHWKFLPLLFLFLFLPQIYSNPAPHKVNSERLTDYEYTILKCCEGAVQLFKSGSESIWKGYDLSKMPYIVYLQNKWVLLLNVEKEIEDFEPYPAEWPSLGTSAQIHRGRYKELAGQLIFNFPVDTVKTVAIGLPETPPEISENLSVYIFGYIVHEVFHQYQSVSFGEIPWEREELYPVLNAENSALAYLEMRLLMDALKSIKYKEFEECKNFIKQFTAVRMLRWRETGSFLERYEQGQEIREGTARYVETKSIELMKDMDFRSSLEGLTTPLPQDLKTGTFPEFILDDFSGRMDKNCISPENMLRNRIYPVGCAEGYILDLLKIPWKNKAQLAGNEFAFCRLLADKFLLDSIQCRKLVGNAKEKYNYSKILRASREKIEEYTDAYENELKEFNSQDGFRFEVCLSAKGTSRSRGTNKKMWIVNNGETALCSNFNIYTLKNNDLLFELMSSGLLENNRWQDKIKTIAFYGHGEILCLTDGTQIELDAGNTYLFGKLEITGDNFKINYSKPGTLTVSGNTINISLVQ